MIESILALFVPFLLLWFIHRRLSHHALDPLAVFCYTFFLFYLFRDFVVTLGLDGPYPDDLFSPSQTNYLLVKGSLTISLFLFFLIVGYVIFRPAGDLQVRLVPVTWTVPTVKKQFRLMIVLTIASTAVTAYLLWKYGGINGVIRAGKSSHALAGSNELRIFPAIAAVVAASTCLTIWEKHGRKSRVERRMGMFALLVALVNAAYVYFWGSRSVAAFVLLVFVAGQWLLGKPKRQRARASAGDARSRRPRKIKVLALVGLALVSVVGLRLLRDNATEGHTSTAIQGQTELRKLSVSTNSTYFDATLLALRDWPVVYPFRNGQDFVIGVDGIVPRKIWPGKPTEITDGSWFRQVYEPLTKNGWPLGAVGDWYLDFGYLGIMFGGFLSGVIFTGLMAAWRRAPLTPFMLAALLCFGVFVVPTGFQALTPLLWFQWALPLLLCARYLDYGNRPAKEVRTPLSKTLV